MESRYMIRSRPRRIPVNEVARFYGPYPDKKPSDYCFEVDYDEGD